MRIYFSYNAVDQLEQMKTVCDEYNLLCSNVYWKDKMLPLATKLSKDLFIFDSGAFTVWKTGGSIDLDKYMDICWKLNEKFEGKIIFVNLDKIPGKFGMSPNPKEIKEACEESWKNYIMMKKQLAGIKIMPVFHQHDEWHWLDKYLQEQPYILGISPANDLTSSGRVPFLNKCFDKTRDRQRTHGLAVTSAFLLEKFPFYSVDSATWILAAAMGNFYTFKDGKVVSTHYSKKDKVEKVNAINLVDQGSPLYNLRRRQNIEVYLKLQTHITDLWEARGVKWENHI